MPKRTDPVLVDRLRKMLADGATYSEAAEVFGLSRAALHAIAVRRRLPRRRRSTLTIAQRLAIRELLQQHYSYAEIAARVGCGRTSIAVHSRLLHEGRVDDEGGGGSEPAAFAPRRLGESRLCPQCKRIVTLWPCVACVARGANWKAGL